MIAKDFPCKTCKHLADRHYINIATDFGVCIGCTTNNSSYYMDEQCKEFVGDNLKYMELQVRKEEIRNES